MARWRTTTSPIKTTAAAIQRLLVSHLWCAATTRKRSDTHLSLLAFTGSCPMYGKYTWWLYLDSGCRPRCWYASGWKECPWFLPWSYDLNGISWCTGQATTLIVTHKEYPHASICEPRILRLTHGDLRHHAFGLRSKGFSCTQLLHPILQFTKNSYILPQQVHRYSLHWFY